MRSLIQRVSRASVAVDSEEIGAIGNGLCALVGVTHEDNEDSVKKLAEKIWNLRCFEDDEGVPNLSAAQLNLPILVVSQFTLYADTSKGRRPSFINAARPEKAEPLIDLLVSELMALGAVVQTGKFQTTMAVELVNDGPFTILLEV